MQQLVDLDQFLLAPRTASTDKKANVGFDQKEKFFQLHYDEEKIFDRNIFEDEK